MGVAALLFPQGHLRRATVVSTFVSVGNATQPFTRLLKAVCELAAQLPQPVFVQFGAAKSFACPGCTGVAFLEMEAFAERVRAAELLILHAGAGSVIHALRAGKTPVVVPRRASLGEHVDDHQLEFSRELQKIGKVFVAHDAATLSQAAAAAVQRQRLSSGAAISELPLVGMVRHALSRAMIEGQ
jgi:beta-1,4-N-acetylglucosaminyltransferase